MKINGETHYRWRAVDHEGEVLESIVTKRRDRRAALKFLKKKMKRYGNPEVVVTNHLKSYGAAMKVIDKVLSQSFQLAEKGSFVDTLMLRGQQTA